MLTLAKTIERRLDAFRDRGRETAVRITPEGVYLKRVGERWSSAVFCPWAAAHSTACKLLVQKTAQQRPARRRMQRGLLHG